MIKGKKPDVKKLLEKGKLSGWELGRLVLMDNVEHDHGRPEILSKEDVRAIQKRMDQLDYKESQEFNRLQNLYKILVFTIQEGKIAGLEAMNTLSSATSLLKRFHTEDSIRQVLMFMLPAIVTKKQYEELKAKEREFKLSELKNLRGVLEHIVKELAPEEAVERWRNPGEGETNFLYLTDFLADSLQEEDRAIVKEAAERLIRLIREGKIRPVLLPEKAIKKLKKLQDDRDDREAQVEDGEEPPHDIQKDIARSGKEDAYRRASYEEGKAKMTEEKKEAIIGLLERVADHSFLLGWGDPEDDLMDFSYCTGREEYEAGVKKWMEFVDTFKGNYEPGSWARADGLVQSMAGIAILQEPSDMIDERGYFDDAASRTLSIVSKWKFVESFIKETYGHEKTIPDFLKAKHQLARNDIIKFLSIKLIIEAVSVAVGVDFAEDLREMEERIEKDIAIYNAFTQPDKTEGKEDLFSGPPHYLGIPKLKALKIGNLKPPAKSLQYYKERIDLSLGDGWIQKIVDAVGFEAEEGGLAQEVVTIAWASGFLKEHGHGKK